MSDLVPFLTDTTPAGLLGLGIVMLMFGWLIPLKMHRTLIASKDAVIAEQAAHIDTQAKTLGALLRGNTATEAVVTATAEVIHQGGVGDGAG